MFLLLDPKQNHFKTHVVSFALSKTIVKPFACSFDPKQIQCETNAFELDPKQRNCKTNVCSLNPQNPCKTNAFFVDSLDPKQNHCTTIAFSFDPKQNHCNTCVFVL